MTECTPPDGSLDERSTFCRTVRLAELVQEYLVGKSNQRLSDLTYEVTAEILNSIVGSKLRLDVEFQPSIGGDILLSELKL